jgi:hypothetical protein
MQYSRGYGNEKNREKKWYGIFNKRGKPRIKLEYHPDAILYRLLRGL